MMRLWLLFFLTFLVACSRVPASTVGEIPFSDIEDNGIVHLANVDVQAKNEFGYGELKLYNITLDRLVENPEKKFLHGESFGFVVSQLSGLAKDAEGYSWYDVDMLVEDNQKNAVLSYQGLLGNGGRVKLAKDVLSVYGNISIPPGASSGDYRFTITVHDRIAMKETAKTVAFNVG